MRSKITNYNKINPTSPDKVKGQFVKYRKGDCLSIDYGDGKYLAAFISEKYNKYYDFTLIEYLLERKPTAREFEEGRFFGNYVYGPDGLYVTSERAMIPCLDTDAEERVEKVGTLNLIENLEKGVYFYVKDVTELCEYYRSDISLRIQRTNNVEKYTRLNQTGNRLIEIRHILNQPLTGSSQNSS